MIDSQNPPKLITALVNWLCGEGMFRDIPGDMIEEFHYNLQHRNRLTAIYRYCITTIGLLSKSFILKEKYSNVQVNVNFILLFNSVKTYVRNAIKSPVTSFLNITGLIVGFASCILVLCYVHNELTFESHLEEKDRIYRVELNIQMPNRFFQSAKSSDPLIDILRTKYPEIETAGRLLEPMEVTYEFNGIHKKESKLFLIEPEILDVLSIEVIKGSKSFFNDSTKVFITEILAKNSLGEENPLGQKIKINDQDYTISGVVKSPPSNTHFKYNILRYIPQSYRENIQKDMNRGWLSNRSMGYIKLKPGADAASFEKSIKNIANEYYGDELEQLDYTLDYYLRPVGDIHLKANNIHELELPGNITHIYVAIFTGLIILLIVSLNFINFMSAYHLKRAKEFEVRRMLTGSGNSQFKQLLIEVMFMLMIIFSISFLFSFFSISLLNRLGKMNLEMIQILDWSNVKFILLLFMVLSISTAFFSKQRINFKITTGSHTNTFRNTIYKGLTVILPFSISIILIVTSVTVYRQVSYLMSKDMGFDKAGKVVISANFNKVSSGDETDYTKIKQAFTAHPYVNAASASWSTPGDRYTALFTARKGEEDQLINYLLVDEDFVHNYHIDLIRGKGIDANDTIQNIVLSKSALPKLGFETSTEAIGEIIEISSFTGRIEARIKGIINDFNYRGLQYELEPLALLYEPQFFRRLTLEIEEGHLEETMLFVETRWKELNLGEYFDYQILSNQINAHYQSESNLNVFVLILASISILLSCTGLMNFISLTNDAKTKEVGIRKVFGASHFAIYHVISKDYLISILLSVALACPFAFFLLDFWLNSFAFSVHLSWLTFGISITIVLLILLGTSLTQTIKMVLSSPVKSIRYE